MLSNMNDYISNPKCEEWNNPFSIYNTTIVYKWEHLRSGKIGFRQIRVKEVSDAQILLSHWNKIQNLWKYTILELN